MSNYTPWMTSTEVIQRLKISRRTLTRMMARGEIKYARLHGLLRFKVEWVDNALLNPINKN